MSNVDPELLAKKRLSSFRIAAQIEAELARKNRRIVQKAHTARNEILDAILAASGVDQALIDQRHKSATEAARRSIEKVIPQLLEVVEVRSREHTELLNLIRSDRGHMPPAPLPDSDSSTIFAWLDTADSIALLKDPVLKPVTYASSIAAGANIVKTVIPTDLGDYGYAFEWLFSWTVPADGILTPSCFVLTNGFQPYSVQYGCYDSHIQVDCYVNFEILTQSAVFPISLVYLQEIEGMYKEFGIGHSGTVQWGNNRIIQSPIGVPVVRNQEIVLSVEIVFQCEEDNVASWLDFNSGSGNLNVPLVTLLLQPSREIRRPVP